MRESTSSRNEHERSAGLGVSVSVGSRGGGRLPRSGRADALGGAEGSDKRPEVKSREYWWNGMSTSEESVGSGRYERQRAGCNIEVEYIYPM